MQVLCTTQTGVTALGQTMRVVAVAKALQRKGHAVRVLAGAKQRPAVTGHGLEFVAATDVPELGGGMFAAMAGPPDEGRMDQIMARMREVLPRLLEAEKEVVARERPDVVVCGSFTGPQAARAFGLPAAMVMLQPHGTKTIEFMTKRLGTAVREKTAGFLAAADLLVMEGMPELDGGMGRALRETGFAALEDRIRYTGPLLAEDPGDLPGQGELKGRHGAAADRPLVYVTIGGGTPLIGGEFLALVLEAFRRMPRVQGVVATGLGLDPKRLENPPDNVAVRGFVPGTELIKASDVTVFHGGSSTLMTCIACGRPAVVVPSMAEQEDNGAVLAQHGAAIVLDKPSLSARSLCEAIQKVLEDASFRAGARRLKELAARYGGAPAAAAMVEGLAGGASS